MIRVMLVNPLKVLCNVMEAVLEGEADMQVVGSATSVHEALEWAPQSDIILVNADPFDRTGYQVVRTMTATGVEARIIVLGLTESAEQVLQFVQAGAHGYVLNNESVDDLVRKIRDVHTGRVPVSPQIASALMSRLKKYSRLLGQVRSNIEPESALTSREQEIMDLIAQGDSNQQIADRLFIEVGTVKNHVHNILQKLGATTRREAAATWALVRDEDRDEAKTKQHA